MQRNAPRHAKELLAKAKTHYPAGSVQSIGDKVKAHVYLYLRMFPG